MTLGLVNALMFIGGGALGVAIALLVAFFLNRFTEFNSKILGSVISIIAGGVVTAFLGADKVYSWAGYCIGLGSMLFLLAFGTDSLDVGKPDDSRKIASQTSATKDPRLQMLDELYERYKIDALTYKEYLDLKQAILSDLEKNPATAKRPRNSAPD
jgi:hypothetical protein